MGFLLQMLLLLLLFATVVVAQRRRWTIEDFKLEKRIGSGGFGQVYLARETESNISVALKQLSRSTLKERHIEHFLVREVEIQNHLQYPNILHLYGYFYDKKHVFLVLEYAAKGELSEQLHKFKYFTERQAATYVASLAQALIYCHDKNVIHRDIKPQNILVVLITLICSSHNLINIVGLVHSYFNGAVESRRYDVGVDIWSLGVLFYEFLYGVICFEAREL
ncbi:serine/threonine-protein kinase Aurora-1-like [Euphorbia lathyris]|uniref:serine/threonine-protein kinase Aurora-1-like n=1 Tax=Euphorbia lathyris TaxID=212925 RepID=UPI0033138280